MQAQPYLDVRQTAGDVARENERMAFDRGIALMEAAASSGPQQTPRDIEAARYLQSLWGILIRDLADPANDLPDGLKADLVSIGLWVMREADAIVAGRSRNWPGLLEVNRSIRAGLNG